MNERALEKMVLCPVDFSDVTGAAIDLATIWAKQIGAGVHFLYVAPQWSPDEATLGSDYFRSVDLQDRDTLYKLRPSDPAVPFRHTFVHGNPGPEIVKASADCQAVVLCTHGHDALMRLLMGSVARYVLRNAQSAVILMKPLLQPSSNRTLATSAKTDYVTRMMSDSRPLRAEDSMESAILELRRAHDSAAPVVNSEGRCVGILTTTDIGLYQQSIRPAAGDSKAVGQHMTSPVITVSSSGSNEAAQLLFQQHPQIHHLVVVDDENRPVGVLARTREK
jgi:nucleotide-binding universal stress UspA family protein/predicted transcriptional regulator